ncbi:hypothetical protein [Pedobacter nototheniae]|uniref:hypothetical protein n=1 Tax=Pedobacter nototheniae TaxID=2488994 RepID=UPI00103C5E9A|nr:hypothetical protein [Pedobacter nototheniae]
MEKFEILEQDIKTGQDFTSVKNLYQLQALFIIASTDLSIITSQMYLCKIKLQHLYFNRQANLTVYEAYETYSAHKQFLRSLVSTRYPELEPILNEINAEEKVFVRKFKIKTTVMDVRNKVGGHIHKNFREWYETVNTLDGEQDARMTIAFIELFTGIFRLTTTLTSLEHQRFIEYEQKSKASMKNSLQKIQDLMDKENEKLPSGQKLDFDLQQIRDLLK